MAAADDPKKEPPKELPKELADVDLASLNLRRAEIVEKQKESADAVQLAKADHFLRFWVGGGLALLTAIWLGQRLPEADGRIEMFFFSAAIIAWLGMWIGAFLSTSAVLRLQDQAKAANKRL